ncbi:MAG: ABC transporter ATP-binding protein [Mycoplasma sp.]
MALLSVNKVIKKINAMEKDEVKSLPAFNHIYAYNPSDKDKILLRMNNVVKRFRNGFKSYKYVLKDFNFTLYKKNHVALIGANGAGKTTLLEIICGVQKANGGEIGFGFPFVYTPFEKVSIQFQANRYPSGLSVNDIIIFLKSVRKGVFIKQNELNEMLEAFNLKSLLYKEANSLSGGQKQRLNVMISLLSNPKLLLLDELTTGLDVYSQKQVLGYLKKYLDKHETTLICVSHNVLEIEELADRIVLLRQGQIVVDADKYKLLEHKQNLQEFVAQYLV